MLMAALRAESDDYVERGEQGHALVVRTDDSHHLVRQTRMAKIGYY